jgi:hypothetical protein
MLRGVGAGLLAMMAVGLVGLIIVSRSGGLLYAWAERMGGRAGVWIERLGTTSLTFGMTAMPIDRDTPHARGTRTIVRVDPATMRAVPWTETFVEHLRPWRADLA